MIICDFEDDIEIDPTNQLDTGRFLQCVCKLIISYGRIAESYLSTRL